jgi:hypothetical protein
VRIFALVIGGLGLAACGMLQSEPVATGPTVPPERVEAFVIAGERMDCSIDPVDHQPLHAAGFSDAELGAIGDQLVTEGRARLTDTGELVLETENCL